MGFYIVHNDIVNMETDAIVNAANSALEMGGGVCGAVFRAAGVKELQEECRKKAPCPTGKAVLTAGYGLKARYIIHVVGPVWKNGEAAEDVLPQRAETGGGLWMPVCGFSTDFQRPLRVSQEGGFEGCSRGIS